MKPLTAAAAGLAAAALSFANAAAPDAPRSRLAANLAAGKPQRVVLFGTSLTHHGAWVHQLSERLEKKHPGLAALDNAGMSGQWSGWGVKTAGPRVAEKKPDAVFIEFSVNDAVARFNCSVAQARSNLLAIAEAVRAQRPDVEIILMTMTPADGYPPGHRSRRENIAGHYQMYRDEAKARGWPLVDINRRWEELRARDPAKYKAFVPDGVHPTAEGCAQIATPEIIAALGL